MKRGYITIILLLISAVDFSQNKINGTFHSLNNQYVKLVGFEGFSNYTIDSVKASDKGHFTLSFGKKDYGMGYLAAEDPRYRPVCRE